MTDLAALYQEVILDHNRYPRHHHKMADATTRAEGVNPVCGDQLMVYLKIHHHCIEAVSFEGKGCAISQASASLMTDMLLGKTETEALQLVHQFKQLVTTGDAPATQQLDKLTVLAGVKHYPGRVKCATLAWHALEAALKHQPKVCTES